MQVGAGWSGVVGVVWGPRAAGGCEVASQLPAPDVMPQIQLPAVRCLLKRARLTVGSAREGAARVGQTRQQASDACITRCVCARTACTARAVSGLRKPPSFCIQSNPLQKPIYIRDTYKGSGKLQVRLLAGELTGGG